MFIEHDVALRVCPEESLRGGVGSLSSKFTTTWTLSQRRPWHHTPVLLPGESHGWKSLVGCSPWGRWESDMTERLHFHFSLSCIGKGSGNPLQCSCLENPRDEEPGGLPSMGSHRVGCDWSDLAATGLSTWPKAGCLLSEGHHKRSLNPIRISLSWRFCLCRWGMADWV